jgi:uncharacterized membrane protein YhdT
MVCSLVLVFESSIILNFTPFAQVTYLRGLILFEKAWTQIAGFIYEFVSRASPSEWVWAFWSFNLVCGKKYSSWLCYNRFSKNKKLTHFVVGDTVSIKVHRWSWYWKSCIYFPILMMYLRIIPLKVIFPCHSLDSKWSLYKRYSLQDLPCVSFLSSLSKFYEQHFITSQISVPY